MHFQTNLGKIFEKIKKNQTFGSLEIFMEAKNLSQPNFFVYSKNSKMAGAT